MVMCTLLVFLKILDPPPVLFARGVFPTLFSLFSDPHSQPHIKED